MYGSRPFPYGYSGAPSQHELIQAIRTLQRDNQQLRRALEARQGPSDRLRDAHTRLVHELETLRKRDHRREAEHKRHHTTVQTLEARLKALEAESNTLRTENSRLRTENSKLRAETATLHDDNQSLTQTNGLLETENEELRAEFEAMPPTVNIDGGAATAKVDLVQSLEEQVRRLSADVNHHKRRRQEDVEQAERAARARLVRDFVETLDIMEQALNSHPDPDDPWVAGSRAIARQMEQVLRRAGAERLGEVGERFDPHLHEAIGVTSENDAIEADHIAQVLH
ncbi:MAG: nucleotide exchange factor GrpE, partial [Myxococcota bacterium]